MMKVSYDDSRLTAFFAELDPKKRKAALRGGITRTAGKVLRMARKNLSTATNGRGRKINTSTGLAKGIRRVVYKREAGFRVTIGTKINRKNASKNQGFHTNRRGLTKPVLIWAEEGTKPRKTRTATKFWTRSRKGHSTGVMTPYRFMRKTREEAQRTVPEEIKEDIRKSMTRLIRKYGR